MKIPFSYKEHIFGSMLAASFVGHLALVGSNGFLLPSPQYNVERAPSSMEMTVTIERPVEEKKIIEQTMAVDQNEELMDVKMLKEKPKEPSKKPLYVPSVKGAIAEAKPDYLKNPAPVYPEYARQQNWEGTVTLRVLVSPKGDVAQIEIDRGSGYDMLDESALKTIRKWRFLPASAGEISFSSWIKIPVRFVLTDEER